MDGRRRSFIKSTKEGLDVGVEKKDENVRMSMRMRMRMRMETDGVGQKVRVSAESLING